MRKRAHKTGRGRRRHEDETADLVSCGFAVCARRSGDSEEAASQTAATLKLQSDKPRFTGERKRDRNKGDWHVCQC